MAQTRLCVAFESLLLVHIRIYDTFVIQRLLVFMLNLSQPYEGLSDFPMEAIAEEEEDEDDDGSSSSGSGTEFIPSAWNREATPNRSALRSPDKKSVSIHFFYFLVQTTVGILSP